MKEIDHKKALLWVEIQKLRAEADETIKFCGAFGETRAKILRATAEKLSAESMKLDGKL